MMAPDPDINSNVESLHIHDISRRILLQRMSRFPDAGPDLMPAGGARYRMEGTRIRVGFAHLVPGKAAEAVRRVLIFARARGLAVQWVVVADRSGAAELPEALADAGFLLAEKLHLMGHDGLMRVPPNPRVQVSPIRTWQEMWQYEYGSRQSFFDDLAPANAIVSHRARDRWREQEHGWCRYYIARIDQHLAGGCYISLFEDVPTIMGVYTHTGDRRAGVATALIAHAIGDSVRPGHEATCLFVHDGNPAERLYRELGFVHLAEESTYSWNG